MNGLIVYLYGMLLFLLPGTLLGLASFQEPWGFLFCGDYKTYQTDHFWNKHGKKMPAHNDFKKKTIEAYSELGLTCRDTLFAKAKYDTIEESLNGNTRGFEDFILGWRNLIQLKGCTLYGFESKLILPAGGTKHSLRYGRWGGQCSFIAANYFTIYERNVIIDFLAGYRCYYGFPSGQIRSHLTLAYDPSPRTQVLATAHLEYGVFNGKTHADHNMICFNPNYRLLKIELQAVFCLSAFSYASVGYYWHAWGVNVGTGGGFFATAAVQF
jgi:hypothetical protein